MSARVLLRLLTLLLGSFYLGSVCELDTEECKQNYAKECHAHVAARPEVDIPAAIQPATPAVVVAAPRWRVLWAAVFPALAARDYQYQTYGLFAQEDWRVFENLTLQAGLRTDYQRPYGLFVLLPAGRAARSVAGSSCARTVQPHGAN